MRRRKNSAYRKRRSGFAALGHAFRERQIYLRAEGEVQFITLKPWAQVTGLTLLLAGLFWLAFSTINIAFKDQLLALRERGMYDARLEYEDRIAAMRQEVDRLNDRLLIDQGEYLSQVDQVKTEIERLVERHKRLVEFFRQSVAAAGEGEAQPGPELPDVLRKPVEEGPADSHGDQSTLLLRPYKGGLNEFDFTEQYAAPFRTAEEAARPLGEIKSMLGNYQRMEVALMDEALDHAERRVARAGKIFKKLGIDDKMVVANSDHQIAAGGPLIPVMPSGESTDPTLERLEKILEAHEAYEKMKYEALQLPLQVPLTTISRMTSGFGIRRDPFRHTIAMHAGVDFKSDLNSAVYATADGKVNIAGWEGAYGRMVEIVHDNGVATRYAHLNSITVAVGDRVKRGDMVGRLGNTGRSTGPHLHYETRVRGRAVDPVQFWQTSNAIQELAKKD
jgi:murein DD-endopeptidase MepM/ murein hydrolase activator NlpD